MLSFIFASIILIRINTDVPQYGLEEASIRSFIGTATKDSKTRGNYKEYSIALERVYNKEGQSASAEGTVTLRIRSAPDIASGRRVHIHMPLANTRYPRTATIVTHEYTSQFWEIRAGLLQAIRRRIGKLPADSATLFRALFLGERDDLSAILVRYFRSAGIIHVLALSGMHLAVLIGACQFIVQPLLGRNYAMIAGLVVGALYIILVGAIPSLLRAYSMYAVAVFIRIFDYPISPAAIIAAAILILILITPDILFEISFQLSSLAVFGIVCIGAKIFDTIRSYLPISIAASISASLGALITSAPLSMYVFGSIYPASIAASIPVNIIVSLFFLLSLALISFPILGFVLNYLLSALFFLLKTIAMWCSRIPELNTPIHFLVFILLTLFCIISMWKDELARIMNILISIFYRGKSKKNILVKTF